MSTESQHSVHVTGLSPSTTSETLKQFFSFCGKISNLQHENSTATIYFVKESAAKTALMLNAGTLDGATISVSSDDTKSPALAQVSTKPSELSAEGGGAEEIDQEEKPYAGRIAEVLAAGYKLSDQAIEQAIKADHNYGISTRFLSFFNPLAEKAKTAASPHISRANEKVAQVDAEKGISVKASAAATIGAKYYNYALSTPLGERVRAFYTSTTKTALEVHEEAKRIASRDKPLGTGATGSTADPVSSTGTAGLSTKPDDKPLETTSA